MKRTLPILIAGLALLAGAMAMRVRPRAEARPAQRVAHVDRHDPAATLPRETTRIQPGAERNLGQAAREAVIKDLVANLKLAIERGDANTERALREGLAKHGEDGRAALEREGLR